MSEQIPLASIQDALNNALDQIESGNLPSQLLQRAYKAAEEQDSREFVLILREIFDSPDLPRKMDPGEYPRLASLARKLELEQVGVTILQEGFKHHPEDPILRWELLHFMATSSLSAVRSSGKEALESFLRIAHDGEVAFEDPEHLKEHSRYFALLMDMLARDEDTDLGLEISEAAQSVVPEDPVILRNYGRALQGAQRGQEAVKVLRRATWLPGAGDLEPNFLATALANLEDQRGALEADLLACTRDPDDGRNFIRSCIALTLAVDEGSLDDDLKETLYRPEVASRIILDALSCRLLSSKDRTMARTLIQGFEIADNPLQIDPAVRDIVENPEKRGPVSLEDRRVDAASWYALVKTDLTAPPAKAQAEGDPVA